MQNQVATYVVAEHTSCLPDICCCWCVLLQVSSQPLPAAAVVLAMHRLRRLHQQAAQQPQQQQQQPEQEEQQQQQLVSQVLQQLTERLAEVRGGTFLNHKMMCGGQYPCSAQQHDLTILAA
jgi:hypothetical protein